MTQLPLATAIPRFKANEERIDIFTNGANDATYTPSSGDPVPTIRKFLLDMSTYVYSVLATGAVANYDTLAAATSDIASIPDNKGVNVNDDGSNNGFYVKIGGVLVRKGDTVGSLDAKVADALAEAALALGKLMDTGDENVVWGVGDPDGEMALSVARNGVTAARLHNIGLSIEYVFAEYAEDGNLIRSIRAWDGHGTVGLRPENDLRFYITGDPPNCTLWLCMANRRPWKITTVAGSYFAPVIEGIYLKWMDLVAGLTQERLLAVNTPETALSTTVTFLNHLLFYGQSLPTGSFDGSVIHSTAVRPGRAVSWLSGPRTLSLHAYSSLNTEVSETVLTNFIDLKESVGVGSVGETMCSGAAIWMTRDTDGLPATEGVLASVHAIGGATIDELAIGTVPFNNLVKSAARGIHLNMLAGRAFRLHVFFGHGEANRSDSMASYLPKLVTLQANLNTQLNALAGSPGEIVLIIDQLASWTASSVLTESEIPLAQLDAAINPSTSTKFALAYPKYILDYVGDGVHLTDDSEALAGAYVGRVAQALRAGTILKPLHALSAVRTGDTIVITWYDTGTPIEFDTTWVSNPGNYGFRWIDNGDGNSVTISSHTATGDHETTMVLSATPTGTGQKIGIADKAVAGVNAGRTTGPRACLRDDSPDVDDLGNPLHNYACIQRIDVTT